MAGIVISLAELLAPRSAQRVVNDTLDFLANPPDPSLVSVRTANWRTGGPYRTLMYRQGLEVELLYQLAAAIAGSAFLRYAKKRWLDWLGQDFFGEPRQGAQFAKTTLTITVPAGAGPYGPLTVRAQTPDGKVFTSDAPVTIPTGPATVGPFGVTAAVAGSAYNVGASQITQLLVPNILGLSVTNAAAATGGYDEESDERYAQRLAAQWGVLSTGSTQAAYVYWALTASQEVQKVRVYSNYNDLGSLEPEAVLVVLAGDASTVSTAAKDAVQAYINPRIPLNAKLYTKICKIKSVTVSGNARIFSQYQSGASAQISQALQQLGKRVPIGSWDAGAVQLSEFIDAAFYSQRDVYDIELTAPTAPIPLDYDEILLPANNLTVIGV